MAIRDAIRKVNDRTLKARSDYERLFGSPPPLSANLNNLEASIRYNQPIQPTSEEVLANTSQDLIEQTAPLRDELIGRSEDFLGVSQPGQPSTPPLQSVTSTPQFDIVRQLADQQAKTARDSILSRLPSGGVLLDKLADVDIGKAQTLSLAGSDIYGRELDRATALATGTPLAAGLGGLGSLAQLEAARAQAAADRDAAQKNALGTGLGMFLGGFDWGD